MKKSLYFFNGYLGSGKTTLINQLLLSSKFQEEAKSVFIIENEISSFSVDNKCLHLDPKQIKVLSGECICCSNPEQLKDILKKVASENYENVIIESSGVTSMNQLLENILPDTELADIYEIKACVFVVDALAIDRTNSYDLEVSDFVVVTKSDALQTEKQKYRLETFLHNQSKNIDISVKFHVKSSEQDELWISELKNNNTKTFREWSLSVNDSKYHGQNFVKVLSGVELENFDAKKAFENMFLYQVVRIKGFYKKNGVLMHVETTPEQIKEDIVLGKIEKVGVVVIGQNKLLLDEFANFANAK